MRNVFEIGTEVSGDSMIGYEYHLKKIINTIVNTNTNLSITGIKRSGKTSLIKEAIRRIEKDDEKIIFLSIDLAKYNSFSEFLRKIVLTVERVVKKNSDLKANEDIIEQLSNIREESPEDFMYREYIGDLFYSICDEGYRITLVIDEFDEATQLFSRTADFELLRNWASDSDMKLSLLLISRRQVYMIEKRNFNNSTFHGIVTSYPINGFSVEDIMDFTNVLGKNGVFLDDEQLSRIWYYAGKSPYVWSYFGYYIIEEYEKNENAIIDIDKLFQEKLVVDLSDHFDAIYDNLSTDKISSEENTTEMNTIDKLNAVIFGPKLGITNDDIDVMKNLGYLDNRDTAYYSISDYFTDLLKVRYSPSKNSVFEAIINVEKKLKYIINENIVGLIDFYKVYGVSENEIQKSILRNTEGIDEGSIRRYDGFVSNNRKVFEKESTCFDVMSLKDSAKIIGGCWETLFKKYFNDDDFEVWKEMFEKCGMARNPVAHGSENLLSDDDKTIIGVYCKKINDQLSEINLKNNDSGRGSTNNIVEYSKKYKERILSNENLIVSYDGVFIGNSSGTTKNLKGKLSNGENGSIRREFFINIDKQPTEFYGKEIPVIIIGPNVQKNGFILEPAVDLLTLI